MNFEQAIFGRLLTTSEQLAVSVQKRSKATSKGLNTSADGVRRVEGSGKCVRTACVRLELLDPAAGHSERCRRATDGSQRLNGLNAGSFQRSDEDRSPTLHQRRSVRGTEAPFDTGRRKSQRRGIGG